MLAITGNLGLVYREWAKEAEEKILLLDTRRQPAEMEFSEEAGAAWYLVHTYPGDDVRALRWLARRKFGVYRPMKQREDKRNGSPLQGWEAAFPGWLFVFVFDIAKNHRRVVSCPGVMGILQHQVSLKPAAIPEWFIQRLRQENWVYKDNAPHARAGTHHEVTAKRNLGRTVKLDKRSRKLLQNLKEQVKKQELWDSSTWARANALAPHERIALLKRALSTAL